MSTTKHQIGSISFLRIDGIHFDSLVNMEHIISITRVEGASPPLCTILTHAGALFTAQATMDELLEIMKEKQS